MVTCPLLPAAGPRRALLLAAGLLATLPAAAQTAPAAQAAAADGPNVLLWLLLAGLGVVGVMLIMTVGSAASAMRWSAEQAEAEATDAAPASAPAVGLAPTAAPVVAAPAPAAVPVHSFEVEEPVLC